MRDNLRSFAATPDGDDAGTQAPDVCGARLSGQSPPLGSDCLFILNTAVAFATCDPTCICAPKGSLPLVATVALLCLSAAVGGSAILGCPCGASTSTSTTTTTTLPPCPDAGADGSDDAGCGGLDCDDGDALINPAAEEICDAVDNDCSDIIDEGC